MNTNKLAAFVAATLSVAAPAAVTSADTKAGNLDWFVGHWCSDRNGDYIEEKWLAPKGDLLLGLSRTVKGARTASFEYLRVEWKDGIPSYIAQPQGAPPVAFKWVAGGADWARFENPAHDFPKRVEYRKTKNGLYAQIAGPGEGGKELVIPFDYKACR